MLTASAYNEISYKFFKKNPKTNFPTVVTIFSAPNYVDSYGNKGNDHIN